MCVCCVYVCVVVWLVSLVFDWLCCKMILRECWMFLDKSALGYGNIMKQESYDALEVVLFLFAQVHSMHLPHILIVLSVCWGRWGR